MSPHEEYIACSSCFSDQGLRLDAQSIGEPSTDACINCGRMEGQKLTKETLTRLAHRFFVWGSFHRTEYGGAPVIEFNSKRKGGEVDFPQPLANDAALIERLCEIGFFYYGPRLWMIGEVEPLKQLQDTTARNSIVKRIVKEYPSKLLDPDMLFYRVRKAPAKPESHSEYDSPPKGVAGNGRLDSEDFPVLYASPDMEVCVHECRFSAEDELYVATLSTTKSLRLLNLTALLNEEESEFESLDISVNMLFLASKNSYEIARAIAVGARDEGFDGLIYPSYFSELRTGVMPLRTTYGISNRMISQYQKVEEALAIPNYAIFGRPIEDGKLAVCSINKIIMSRVEYGFHFGPVGT
jgi:hypothetical protein